jgi:hypothetical protein
MNGRDVANLLRFEIMERIAVTPLNGGFLVRLPFTDSMGDPIEMSITLTPGGLILDDLGHTAGLLFDLAQHGEEAPGHILVKNLADAYQVTIDYDRGVLSRAADLITDASAIVDFIKVLVSAQTVLPEIQRRKGRRLGGSRLHTRLGREIQLLLFPEYVQRQAVVAGKHETWLVDYKYVSRKGDEVVDILLVTADLRVQDPREKAEHVLTLAVDVLEAPNKPDLRVVYDLDGDGDSSAAQRVAALLKDYQHRIGYRTYNYGDPQEKAALKELTLQELSPMHFPQGNGGSLRKRG